MRTVGRRIFAFGIIDDARLKLLQACSESIATFPCVPGLIASRFSRTRGRKVVGSFALVAAADAPGMRCHERPVSIIVRLGVQTAPTMEPMV